MAARPLIGSDPDIGRARLVGDQRASLIRTSWRATSRSSGLSIKNRTPRPSAYSGAAETIASVRSETPPAAVAVAIALSPRTTPASNAPPDPPRCRSAEDSRERLGRWGRVRIVERAEGHGSPPLRGTPQSYGASVWLIAGAATSHASPSPEQRALGSSARCLCRCSAASFGTRGLRHQGAQDHEGEPTEIASRGRRSLERGHDRGRSFGVRRLC